MDRGRWDCQRLLGAEMNPTASALSGRDGAARVFIVRAVKRGSGKLRLRFGEGVEGQQGNERPHIVSAKETTARCTCCTQLRPSFI